MSGVITSPSDQQMQVIRMVAEGWPLEGIAAALEISRTAVKYRLRVAAARLGVKPFRELIVAEAFRRGLLT